MVRSSLNVAMKRDIFRKKIKRITEKIDLHWRLCLGVIIIAQILFFVLSIVTYGVYDPDTNSFLEPAYSFLETGRMLDQGEPILFRTPGYIFFLAAVLSVTSGSEMAVVVIQILMWIAATIAIYYIVSGMTDKKYCGVLACLLYSANVSAYKYNGSILTDGFFSCVLIFAMFYFYRYMQVSKCRYIVGTFALLMYALLVRPQLTYFCMILVVVLIVCAVVKKVSWKIAILYGSMFLLMYGGWMVRNYSYYEGWMYSSVQDYNYMYYYAPGVYILAEDGSTREEAIEYLENEFEVTYPDYENYNDMELAHAQKEIGCSYIKQHPLEFVELLFEGLFIEMFGSGTTFLEGMIDSALCRLALSAFVAGTLLLTYLIYAVGFLKNITRQKVFDWLILLSAMYLMASTAMVGYSRFRLAFYPLCIVGAFISWRNSKPQEQLTDEK